MRLFYLDASVLAKRYALEKGSQLINAMMQQVSYTELACATLGILELISILVRKKNDGRLAQGLFEQAMINFKSEILDNDGFSTISITDMQIIAAANLITKHNLNATDALILKSVMDIAQILDKNANQLVLWTTDQRLERAALLESIVVFNPEKETQASLNILLTRYTP